MIISEELKSYNCNWGIKETRLQRIDVSRRIQVKFFVKKCVKIEKDIEIQTKYSLAIDTKQHVFMYLQIALPYPFVVQTAPGPQGLGLQGSGFSIHLWFSQT